MGELGDEMGVDVVGWFLVFPVLGCEGGYFGGVETVAGETGLAYELVVGEV